MTEIWESQVFMPFQPGVPQQNRAAEPPIAVPGYAVMPAAEVEQWLHGYAARVENPPARPNIVLISW